MKYCTKCGEKNPDEAKFCAKCGQTFVVESKNDSHVLRVYNALYYIGNREIQILRNGKRVGSISKNQYLDVEIFEDCTIGVKLGSATKECSVTYKSPGILVCQNDLWKGVSLLQYHSEGADQALSIAADNASKTKAFITFTWIVAGVVIGGILLSELWDWLSCL